MAQLPGEDRGGNPYPGPGMREREHTKAEKQTYFKTEVHVEVQLQERCNVNTSTLLKSGQCLCLRLDAYNITSWDRWPGQQSTCVHRIHLSQWLAGSIKCHHKLRAAGTLTKLHAVNIKQQSSSFLYNHKKYFLWNVVSVPLLHFTQGCLSRNRPQVDERRLRNWGDRGYVMLMTWHHGYVVMVANGNNDASMSLLAYNITLKFHFVSGVKHGVITLFTIASISTV